MRGCTLKVEDQKGGKTSQIVVTCTKVDKKLTYYALPHDYVTALLE